MDRDEAIKLLKGGKERIDAWNQLRRTRMEIPDLRRCDLRRVKLFDVDLRGVNLFDANFRRANLEGANLKGANLCEADLNRANLRGADLVDANLRRANLEGANLKGANLEGANLRRVSLFDVDLSDARLIKADLRGADLVRAGLSNADLSGADLNRARLTEADLSDAVLSKAICGWSVFGSVDLASVMGLETVEHKGPSTIGVDTLRRSRGKIPREFLRGCGLAAWEVELTRLYDDCLDVGSIAELLSTRIFEARSKGPLFIGGIFISYSQTDSVFVDKVRKALYDAGASVWLDRHDAVSGDLQKQIGRAIRMNDVVLLVLSESSVKSDWVEHELDMARKKEKEENRDVLCPVAIDDSWKGKADGDVLWRQLKKKNVLDFAGWKTKKFSGQFDKLVKGLKINY